MPESSWVAEAGSGDGGRRGAHAAARVSTAAAGHGAPPTGVRCRGGAGRGGRGPRRTAIEGVVEPVAREEHGAVEGNAREGAARDGVGVAGGLALASRDAGALDLPADWPGGDREVEPHLVGDRARRLRGGPREGVAHLVKVVREGEPR